VTAEAEAMRNKTYIWHPELCLEPRMGDSPDHYRWSQGLTALIHESYTIVRR